MFNIELKFTCDILIKWFDYKTKSSRISIPNVLAIEYNRQHTITAKTKCCLCNFPLDVAPKGLEFPGNEMSYLDFLIKKEHAFPRNIYNKTDLEKSKNIVTEKMYHESMLLFIHLVRVAENEIKMASTFDQIYDEKLEKILREYCPAYEFSLEDMIETEIKTFEIKNSKTTKIPKFTMQIYAFIYDCLMDFPYTKFDEIKTVTTKGFLNKMYKIINSKVHLSHSHVTGEIIGHSHDYCNWKLRENKTLVSLIGHNFLGFDIFYMIKGYRSTCWGTKDYSMGGTNLTNVNFANIGAQVKIIDSLKYYQATHANIAATTDETEKSKIKSSVQLFLSKHEYFSNIWANLIEKDQTKILDIVAEGKGALPYEKIVNINSLRIAPDEFFLSTRNFIAVLIKAIYILKYTKI